ncbi:MAG: NAD(P)/FAD-dependent oxidoreductase [Chitinophagaceae bacterium]|nr:NAD(P)/FAD-dependent oxidoreductase [Chitinophagaceae bacterium]
MHLIVIGGGAAGFFCAVNAARMNTALKVSLVEKTGKLLAKVRISGGGRCNVTHACFSIPDMMKKYPRGGNFVKKAFHEFFTEDTISWFNERSVKLKTEKDGRMFPVTDSSETIINCLLSEAKKYNVGIRTNREVRSLVKTENGWTVQYTDGESEYADFICVACGGYPKENMFGWLKETGHSVEAPVPSLFTFNMPGNAITQLTGVSTEAKARIQGTKLEETGAVLITHWGMSGPAVLKLSARGARELNAVKYQFTALINWCPGYNENSLRETITNLRQSNPSQKIINGNVFDVPRRLWEFLITESDIHADLRWADLSTGKLNALIKNLSAHELKVQGKTTFREEFVTAGGIRLPEVNAATMESRIAQGLYFAGEILDVDGVTGGFNFQHAWTSGWIAAKSISARSLSAK